MNFARCKRWLFVALLGLFAFASTFTTAIPTAQADHHYRHGVVVVHPEYHYGYGYHRPVRVYGGGPRVIVAPPPTYYYYGRHHRHHYGPYYRY